MTQTKESFWPKSLWRLVILASFTLPPEPALAFGAEGHRLIAQIAEHYLTPLAQKKVQVLLRAERFYGLAKCPVKSLADAATWPDCLRGFGATYKNTFPWHFDDIPLCGEAVYLEDYANDQCLSAQTTKFIAVLSNNKASMKNRLQALKFVAHLIGDAHQPLHATTNGDRAGNQISVSFLNVQDSRLNLHHVWDTELITKIIEQMNAP